MSLLKQKTAQIREKRLNALGAYLGDTANLLRDIQNKESAKQRIRTFSQTTFDEIINVLRLINGIYDAVTVIHGPKGCGAAQLFLNSQDEKDGRWVITGLNERDSIMGGDTKLREAVISVYERYKPRIIFIVATPVVAITNDDIQAVAEDLKEELGVNIVPIYSDGFKSKTGLTGYDVALHALAKHLIANQKEDKGDFINLISITENLQDIKEIEGLLTELGLKANILPRLAGRQNFAQASQAKLSVSINPDYSDYLGKALADKYDVTFLQPPLPIGIKGTYQWLSAIAEAVGLNQEVDLLHAKAAQELIPLLENNQLSNTRVYISLPTATSLGIATLLEELSAKVVGLTIEHIDSLHEKSLTELLVKEPNLQLHVAKGQPFEEANILQRLKPDLYIGGLGQPVWAAKLGIPAISLENTGILGYGGIRRFIHQAAKALTNKSFVHKLARNTGLPYQNNWYQKSSHWYIKLEVK